MCSLVASSATGASFELLAPAGLALLGLLAPLLLLYILKVKRRRRRVASTWLWASARRDLMARSPFKRLILQTPLLVQGLAIVALSVALARPATRGRAFAGDHVAVIIDASASMSASTPGSDGETTTRIDLAKRTAKDILASLTPGSDALVLEAGRDAHLLSALDRDMVRVKAAVDRARARDVEGDLGPAVALAADRLRQLGGSRRIVVLTDGNLAHPGALSGVSIPIEVMTVGAPVDNAAIVRVDVRSGRDPVANREQVQAFLLVANFGPKAREVYVTMREDGASDVLASRRVLVQPGERLPLVLTFHPSRGDYAKGLVFEMTPHDGMPVDDTAYGRVPAGDKLPVFLVGASPWIERALASDPMVDLRAGTLADLEATPVDLDGLVVIDGACPPSPPGGDLLIVHPPPGRCFGATVGAAVELPEITSWDAGDPRMRFLTLDGVHIARANLLEPETPSQRLIGGRSGILAADISTSARPGTLLGFDVGESDWPLKASFVLFVRNLIEQARTHRAQGITGPARVGEPLRLALPATATQVEALGPAGESVDISQRGGLAVIPDVARAGFYRISWKGPQRGSKLVPANLTSAAESDLTPRALNAVAERVTVAGAAQPDAHEDWTWILALGALGLVVFDVWWFTRDPRPPSPVGRPARPKMPERKAA